MADLGWNGGGTTVTKVIVDTAFIRTTESC